MANNLGVCPPPQPHRESQAQDRRAKIEEDKLAKARESDDRLRVAAERRKEKSLQRALFIDEKQERAESALLLCVCVRACVCVCVVALRCVLHRFAVAF